MMFHLIREAYETLSDSERRKAYDTYLKTSSIQKARSSEKPSGKTSAAGGGTGSSSRTNTVEYITTRLNYILWEMEDILTALRKKKMDDLQAGDDIRHWMMEILQFMDRWLLEPAGFGDYFYQARGIKNVRLYRQLAGSPGATEHMPYAGFNDYFYNIRKRMNQFIGKVTAADLMKTAPGTSLKIADNVSEVFRMSYYYLGGINQVLNGKNMVILRFIHSNRIYENDPVSLLGPPS